MGRKLYCGNLSFNVSGPDLEQLFGQYGAVLSAQVVTDRDTGRSRGFGFVEMADDAAARAAIEEMHDSELGGRNLTVNEARPRTQRGGRGGDRGDRGDRGGRSRW